MRFWDRFQRAIRKPPRVIVRRVWNELSAEAERFIAPWRARRFGGRRLCDHFGVDDLDQLWGFLGSRPFPFLDKVDRNAHAEICPLGHDEIFNKAKMALDMQVDLLGSGPVFLGEKPDWHKDYKSGYSWTPEYFRSIDYVNPGRPSDVKFPWEVSRFQWLIPVGQAYVLTGDERYAEHVRDLIIHWIEENPYASSVNWACTMEVAIRLIVWIWFFNVFRDSRAWADGEFREKFLCMLYLHGDFTSRHLEYSDVNGNHYTADAVGLIYAGLFFSGAKEADVWWQKGWEILLDEFPRQVSNDGVDYEGSVSYHRLVQELFLYAAIYMDIRGHEVPDHYLNRLKSMARFTHAYTQPDGMSPWIGDADNARLLPFGPQDINDHRYIIGIMASWMNDDQLRSWFSGPRSEIVWSMGEEAARGLPDRVSPPDRISSAFREGGYYVLQSANTHVFVDCAPVGLAGRGGHGHNDCLSFEACLAGKKIVTDSGAYVYTADYKQRNRFRSTAFHNTPIIDGEEINRFIRPDYLWNLHYDALPTVREWSVATEKTSLVGLHEGYKRLPGAVEIEREFVLDHRAAELMIRDEIRGSGRHLVEIPIHLAPNMEVFLAEAHRVVLRAQDNSQYEISWDCDGMDFRIIRGKVSPSYGVRLETQIIWLYGQFELPIRCVTYLRSVIQNDSCHETLGRRNTIGQRN